MSETDYHNHAYGKDACPNPACVAAENHEFEKTLVARLLREHFEREKLHKRLKEERGSARFDLNYNGLPANNAGIHFGWGPEDKSDNLCRGRVLNVLLPGEKAVAHVCTRCHATAFRPRSHDGFGAEIRREGDSCPDCCGRGRNEIERGDGMIIGYDNCGSCYATGKVTLRQEPVKDSPLPPSCLGHEGQSNGQLGQWW